MITYSRFCTAVRLIYDRLSISPAALSPVWAFAYPFRVINVNLRHSLSVDQDPIMNQVSPQRLCPPTALSQNASGRRDWHKYRVVLEE